MKKILVIGSAVADVIIRLEGNLPRRGEDVHILSQEMRLGGCAYNVYDTVRHFGVPCIPFFPVGSGAYGDMVWKEFAKRGVNTPIPRPEAPNGCCYCFIETDGERTFISYHGAEYRFEEEWFSLIDVSDIGGVYICGLEIEEPTGEHVVHFLERHPFLPVYFAPGPRLSRIRPSLMKRIFALHPVLHLNDEEACEYTQTTSVKEAAKSLFQCTGQTVLITLGKNGCFWFDGTSSDTVPAFAAHQVDTVGAGDAHIGAILAGLSLGRSLSDAIRMANRVSAAIVETEGALLTDEAFASLHLV